MRAAINCVLLHESSASEQSMNPAVSYETPQVVAMRGYFPLFAKHWYRHKRPIPQTASLSKGSAKPRPRERTAIVVRVTAANSIPASR